VHGERLPGRSDGALEGDEANTSVSLAARLTGVNSLTSTVDPKSRKNRRTWSWLVQIPYQGAAPAGPSAAQSTSSVRSPRIASTSPRPKASYRVWMVLMLVSALMAVPSPAVPV